MALLASSGPLAASPSIKDDSLSDAFGIWRERAAQKKELEQRTRHFRRSSRLSALTPKVTRVSTFAERDAKLREDALSLRSIRSSPSPSEPPRSVRSSPLLVEPIEPPRPPPLASSTAVEFQRHLAILNESTDDVLVYLKSQGVREIEQIRIVLDAPSDNTARRWRHRFLTNAETIQRWAKASCKGEPRSKQIALDRLSEFEFDKMLSDGDPEKQAEAWNSTRSDLLGLLKACCDHGCEWSDTMRNLLAAAHRPSSGNARIRTYADRATEDEKLTRYFPFLSGDNLILQLDLSFRSRKYGQETTTHDWDQCTARQPSEDLESMLTRFTEAFKRSQNSGFKESQIWENPTHCHTFNTRIQEGLLNDTSAPDRGVGNAAAFAGEWARLKRIIEKGEADRSVLSARNIIDNAVIGREHEYRIRYDAQGDGHGGLGPSGQWSHRTGSGSQQRRLEKRAAERDAALLDAKKGLPYGREEHLPYDNDH